MTTLIVFYREIWESFISHYLYFSIVHMRGVLVLLPHQMMNFCSPSSPRGGVHYSLGAPVVMTAFFSLLPSLLPPGSLLLGDPSRVFAELPCLVARCWKKIHHSEDNMKWSQWRQYEMIRLRILWIGQFLYSFCSRVTTPYLLFGHGIRMVLFHFHFELEKGFWKKRLFIKSCFQT